ncbi:MAG: hypothetical protein ACI8R4_001573 [Paracoccaceae bacterium]|jgi:hypothetical protein
MRAALTAFALGILTACAPPVPDSGAGVGFDNSTEAQLAREAALNTGQPLVPPSVLSQEALAPAAGSAAIPTVVAGVGAPAQLPAVAQPVAPSTARATPNTGNDADIANETAAALALASSNSGQVPVQASPSNPAPVLASTSGISDENNFSAVSSRHTIASDAERLAQNRAQFQVIAPTALPKRTAAGSQPNIVNYALQTNNPRGTKIYTRSGFNRDAKAARNCATFASADQAQTAFLSQGGPQKDRKGLDPDGDGYACTWDPAPFRQAVNN